ncbi:hypothetical protein VE03_05880 [Pseudogymnoascus sp. 23342-1-I1]|nr:hypothetical protein VE03_05880 [Pseudogymnoascus sp. 23342-1-I1]
MLSNAVKTVPDGGGRGATARNASTEAQGPALANDDTIIWNTLVVDELRSASDRAIMTTISTRPE